MNKVGCLSIMALFSLLACSAHAQEVKLAVVDMQVVLREAPQIAKINDSLNKQFKGRQSEIIQAQHNLESEATNLEKNAAVMKETDRINLEKKVMTDRNKVQTMIASFQKDVSAQQSKLFEGFSKQLGSVVNKLADQSSYDVVIQKNNLLYAKNNLDITQQVVDALKRA